MDKTFDITDLVVIGDRVTTIVKEAKNKTSLRARAIYSISDVGIQPEGYVAIVRAGPGHWKHFAIGERDFKFLRWAGVKVEVISGPAASRLRSAPKAACLARLPGDTPVTLRAERPEEYRGPSSPKVLAVT